MSKLVIFDYDGTLCATHDAISHALTEVFIQRMQLEVDAIEVSRLIGRGITLLETVREIHPQGAALSDDELNEWQQHYRAIYRETSTKWVTAFPDAVKTVVECSTFASTAVVSNKGKAALESSLRQLGFSASVNQVFADDGVSPKKPDPALYSEVIRTAFPDALPSSTIMVGDTAADLQFARDSGIVGCWAQYGYGNADDCHSIGYDYRIAELKDLIPIILSL